MTTKLRALHITPTAKVALSICLPIVNENKVYQTTDEGNTWQDITPNEKMKNNSNYSEGSIPQGDEKLRIINCNREVSRSLCIR